MHFRTLFKKNNVRFNSKKLFVDHFLKMSTTRNYSNINDNAFMFKLINDDELFLSNLNFEKIEQFTKFVKEIQITIIWSKIVAIERKTNTNANRDIKRKTNTIENHETRFKKVTITITIISNKIVVIERKANTNENYKKRFKERRPSMISISDIQNQINTITITITTTFIQTFNHFRILTEIEKTIVIKLNVFARRYCMIYFFNNKIDELIMTILFDISFINKTYKQLRFRCSKFYKQ